MVDNNYDNISIENALNNIEWTNEHESIFVEWADKALCYRWLHTKCNQRYSRSYALFTVPVIIMSTVTGTANFAQDRFPDEYKDYVSMGIGAINLFAGILTTIQQFLKIGELNEAHRVASIAWDKFYRNVKVELAKPPSERMPVLQILKHSKEEFDRLMETSPIVLDVVVEEFKKTFSGGAINHKDIKPDKLTKKQIAYLELHKPEICDTITSTSHSVYKRQIETNKTYNKLTSNAITLARKAIEFKKKQEKVQDIIIQFQKQQGRMPTNQEIVNELDGHITLEFVENYVNEEANTIPTVTEQN